VAFRAVLAMHAKLVTAMAIETAVARGTKAVRSVTGATGLVSRRDRAFRSGGFECVASNAASSRARCCVLNMTARTVLMLWDLQLCHRSDNGLVTTGASLDSRLALMRRVARRAALVPVSVLGLVTVDASSCWGLSRVSTVATETVGMTSRLPAVELSADGCVAFTALRGGDLEPMRHVATRTALVSTEELVRGAVGGRTCVASNAELRCLGTCPVDLVAL
jgi:hypothetical protein